MTSETDWWTELYTPDHSVRDAVDRLTGVVADLHLQIGALRDDRARALADIRDRVFQDVYPVAIPARSAQVTSGGALTIADAEQLGPRSGIYWDVRRVSVFGLASSETVNLFKVASATTASAAAQNFVCTISQSTPFQAFGLGQVMLRAHESLMVTGTGLTNGEWVTMSADGFSIGAEWIGLYLL